MPPAGQPEIVIVQEKESKLAVEDADTDVLFDREIGEWNEEAYRGLKTFVLKSARDFQRLYDAIPDKDFSVLPERATFYGAVPRTARQMYNHTRGVNAHYFGEIQVSADDTGRIADCRERGFAELERRPDYLQNRIWEGPDPCKSTVSHGKADLWPRQRTGRVWFRTGIKRKPVSCIIG